MCALASGLMLAWPAMSRVMPTQEGVLHAAPRPADAPAQDEAQRFARGVLESNDHRQRPFAVVDKKQARLVLYAPDGRVLGAAPVLLGLQPGDHAVPGVGRKPLSAIRPDERTTPAGRFETEPGRNLAGELLVWFDYAEGLALHRLRPAPARERRAGRLASATPADNRISLGCVVVDPAFYTSVVQPVLGRRRGVIYVLPEHQPLAAVFERQLLAGLDSD
ncbi:murein L,D-transpeptidase [Azohydromonas sp. G-1-1-14]|uniref:Murein L,D-transpeptidase n=1 Tax=Azohydromonas caseinilytica TaxID=2728836 RepID=A0A848FAT3_9BURK|nr:murein L,D-transpeptidase [Azohydromonas caseinilytica]